MKNKSAEKEKINLDYSLGYVPESARNFMPDVYRDGDRFICVLGIGPNAVTGQGATIEEALKDWDRVHQEKAQ
jgi:hypothetical protein